MLLAEPTRATLLDALMAGEPLPAGELARRAGIASSTASGHLARLRAGRLVSFETVGRQRRYRLASPAVAEAIEALARIAPPPPTRSLRAAERDSALRFARMCYDHLAGELGVALTDALVSRKMITPDDGSFRITSRGERRLALLGVDLDGAQAARRSFARSCLDWSEHREHLAGALGAALADALIAQKVIARRPRDRAVTVTPKGRDVLCELGVRLAAN